MEWQQVLYIKNRLSSRIPPTVAKTQFNPVCNFFSLTNVKIDFAFLTVEKVHNRINGIFSKSFVKNYVE